jgi:inner membrane protein
MLGKTHFAVGVTVGLAVMKPATIQELILGVAASAVGAVISDIDAGTSESHRDADRIMAGICIAVGLLVLAETFCHVEIYQRLMSHNTSPRMITGVTGLLILCAFGKEQPHRSFMHSLLGLGLLSCCVYLLLPMAAPYFAVAFISHLFLDLLNKKKTRLLWPSKKGFALGFCSSHGLFNGLFLCLGNVCGLAIILYLIAQIYIF